MKLFVVIAALVAISSAWSLRKRGDENEGGFDFEKLVDKIPVLAHALYLAHTPEDLKAALAEATPEEIRYYVGEMRAEFDIIEAWGYVEGGRLVGEKLTEEQMQELGELEGEIKKEEDNLKEQLPGFEKEDRDHIFLDGCIEAYKKISEEDFESTGKAKVAVLHGISQCSRKGMASVRGILKHFAELSDEDIVKSEIVIDVLKTIGEVFGEFCDLHHVFMEVLRLEKDAPQDFMDEVDALILDDENSSKGDEGDDKIPSDDNQVAPVSSGRSMRSRFNVLQKIKARMALQRMLRKLNIRK